MHLGGFCIVFGKILNMITMIYFMNIWYGISCIWYFLCGKFFKYWYNLFDIYWVLWMEEPGRLQSMGLLRVGHHCAISLSLFLSCTGEGNGNPLQCPCLENPRDGGAWWAAIYGVAQSQTRLMQLSSSSGGGGMNWIVPLLPNAFIKP